MSLFPSRTIALSIGPVAIHWYGVMYALAFLLAFWLLPRLARYRNLTLSAADRDSLMFACFLGVLLGGRLGYVLFYDLRSYLQDPLEMLAVWHGGMSSHGGFIGVILALWMFARRKNVSLLALGDIIVVPVAIGLALGRLGNLINGELYGMITAVPWAMHFQGVEGFRHPTQIYAIVKDLFIALICLLHLMRTRNQFRAGATSAIFLILYGILRFIVEIYREQPFGFVSIGGLSFSWGQIYTMPIFLCGIGVFWLCRTKSPMPNVQ